MPFRITAGGVAALAAAALIPPAAHAQTCRVREIVTSQCVWFALDELGGNKAAARRAEQEATSDLVDGCSQGQYQMVLLHGTGMTYRVVKRLKARGIRDVRRVRAACAAAARRLPG